MEKNQYINIIFDKFEDSNNLCEIFSICSETNNKTLIASYEGYTDKALSDFFLNSIQEDIISLAMNKTYIDDIKIFNLI
jgi:hypothetical protein